jgi:hypothetical protein
LKTEIEFIVKKPKNNEWQNVISIILLNKSTEAPEVIFGSVGLMYFILTGILVRSKKIEV